MSEIVTQPAPAPEPPKAEPEPDKPRLSSLQRKKIERERQAAEEAAAPRRKRAFEPPPRATGDRIEVIVYSHEPVVVAAVFFASARQPFAVREWHLEEDGILILCKCEKRPCPQHDMIFAPTDAARIEAQIEREIDRLCVEYGVPIKRVTFFTYVQDNFLPMPRLTLRGEWKDDRSLAAARAMFQRNYPR